LSHLDLVEDANFLINVHPSDANLIFHGATPCALPKLYFYRIELLELLARRKPTAAVILTDKKFPSASFFSRYRRFPVLVQVPARAAPWARAIFIGKLSDPP